MRLLTMTAVLFAGLIAVSACGAAGGGHAAPSASPSLTDAQIQTVVNELVQCIRDNGAPGMPDVKVQNGHVIDPDETTVDETTKTNFKSALAACDSIKNKLPPSVFGDDRQQRPGENRDPTAQDLPALRKFAQCMRDNGIPEWPDPKADGSFPVVGTPLEREGKTERLGAAVNACRQYWSGGIKYS